MKYSVTCNKCGKRAVLKLSAPGDIKCKCPTCGNVFPVHVSRASFAEEARRQEEYEHARMVGGLSQRTLNRRLAAFFIGSLLFVCSVIGGLKLCAMVAKAVL